MFLSKWLVSSVRPVIDRFPRAAALYRSVRDQLDGMQEAIQTPWNFKLAGNATMAQGKFEPEETELVRKLLLDIDLFINVGANVGYYCCHALSLGKQVIAFEPIERNLRYICKNVIANDWDGVEIYPVALSDHIGVLEIYGGNTGASVVKGWAGIPENYVTLAPCSTMNTILNNRLAGKRALIVADIEGAEKWMLDGASIILANDPKPIWLVEIVTKEHQPIGVEINPNFISIFQLFFQHGYSAFTADKEMRQITNEDVKLISQGLLEVNTHNYLFCESKDTL